jgi:hypothetical protein
VQRVEPVLAVSLLLVQALRDVELGLQGCVQFTAKT